MKSIFGADLYGMMFLASGGFGYDFMKSWLATHKGYSEQIIYTLPVFYMGIIGVAIAGFFLTAIVELTLLGYWRRP